MKMVANPDRAEAGPRPVLLCLTLAAVALIAAAPAAWAGPAQEEYNLELPRADGGTPTNPAGAGSELGSGDQGTTPPSSELGSEAPATTSEPGGGSGDGGAGNGDRASADELLAQTRDDASDSSLVSAGTSAAGSSPVGPLLIAVAVLIALAGVLAIRQARRARASTPD